MYRIEGDHEEPVQTYCDADGVHRLVEIMEANGFLELKLKEHMRERLRLKTVMELTQRKQVARR